MGLSSVFFCCVSVGSEFVSRWYFDENVKFKKINSKSAKCKFGTSSFDEKEVVGVRLKPDQVVNYNLL